VDAGGALGGPDAEDGGLPEADVRQGAEVDDGDVAVLLDLAVEDLVGRAAGEDRLEADVARGGAVPAGVDLDGHRDPAVLGLRLVHAQREVGAVGLLGADRADAAGLAAVGPVGVRVGRVVAGRGASAVASERRGDGDGRDDGGGGERGEVPARDAGHAVPAFLRGFRTNQGG